MNLRHTPTPRPLFWFPKLSPHCKVFNYTICAKLPNVIYLAEPWVHLKFIFEMSAISSEWAKTCLWFQANLKISLTSQSMLLVNSGSRLPHTQTCLSYCVIPCTVEHSLTSSTYPEAEQSLSKCEKLTKERSKISSVSDSDVDEWNVKVFTAIARYILLNINILI